MFRVEGIPLSVHVDDSTRNLFVEFAFIRASSVVHPELPHLMAGERSSDCTLMLNPRFATWDTRSS